MFLFLITLFPISLFILNMVDVFVLLYSGIAEVSILFLVFFVINKVLTKSSVLHLFSKHLTSSCN